MTCTVQLCQLNVGTSAESRHRVARSDRRAFQFHLSSGIHIRGEKGEIARSGLSSSTLHYHDSSFLFVFQEIHCGIHFGYFEAVLVARIRVSLVTGLTLRRFCLSVRTPLVTRPLHTRSPRGEVLAHFAVPESRNDCYCPVASMRQLVIARSSNRDAPRRRDQTVGISVLSTHVTAGVPGTPVAKRHSTTFQHSLDALTDVSKC